MVRRKRSGNARWPHSNAARSSLDKLQEICSGAKRHGVFSRVESPGAARRTLIIRSSSSAATPLFHQDWRTRQKGKIAKAIIPDPGKILVARTAYSDVGNKTAMPSEFIPAGSYILSRPIIEFCTNNRNYTQKTAVPSCFESRAFKSGEAYIGEGINSLARRPNVA
jgi:hypothetical protein